MSTLKVRTARSYLFVPANRPERFQKATESGADAVVVDLEDSVPPSGKHDARDALADSLSPHRPVIVRVNAVDTPWYADDLKLCAHPAVAKIMIPKAEEPPLLQSASRACGGKKMLALLETGLGIANARAIARAGQVERLVFGSLDLQLDLGIEGDDEELLAFRSELVLAARLGGLEAPVDGVTQAIQDQAQLTRDARRARLLGFGAKLCIHPGQIAAVNAAFSPSDSEVAWALKVMKAADDANGAAVALDGKMIDMPVIRKAKRVLDLSGSLPGC